MPTVLVVEDERDIREVLRRYLERAGLSVLTTGTGAEAIRLLTSAPPDLVVLDLGLPDVDGTDVLREVRAAGSIPVVVLTARSALEDRICGLQLGADDYVTKPFSPHEVVLRVQAVLHRAGGLEASHDPVSYGQGRLRIDEPRHEAWLAGRPMDLTPTEWGLLTAVAAAPERVFSRYELVNRVRGYEYAGYERTIDSHVKNLRRKFGPSGTDVLETVLGVGYRLRLRRDDPR
jgi:DNA-binding response OmpR family regulator